MDYDLIGGDSYPALTVTLSGNDQFVSEAGAMAWMDTNIKVKTSSRGGILSGLSRKFLTGESFFQNVYSVEGGGPGSVTFVAGSPGSIVQHELDGDLNLEKGAYLASSTGVNIESKFEGLKGLFNEGLFVMRATGRGTLFFSGYGDVRCVEVNGRYDVDNGYAVAWEPTLRYQLGRAGKKIRSFLFSDQLILKFEGHGRLWVQSRSPQSLANFLNPFRASGGGGLGGLADLGS